jgi:hypothetical protein
MNQDQSSSTATASDTYTYTKPKLTPTQRLFRKVFFFARKNIDYINITNEMF